MIIAMIETEEGAAAADKIGSADGVDGVFIASSDLSSFSGYRQ